MVILVMKKLDNLGVELNLVSREFFRLNSNSPDSGKLR
jgi:hypothetical protein